MFRIWATVLFILVIGSAFYLAHQVDDELPVTPAPTSNSNFNL